ncbi:unnamed protein product [Microthlaspi erraticum]|uniref:Uncharacterized protein n=1 Tax=Microthlaspi erraticum TaxID=1685480 RepID=A0A6D2JA31_9BRAS|nr:unnamed protein product [Microthlaspi erraticum]
MDFIKTSSLRALIELTFQRNWNGLIWMSRKGVIAKRVKTVQRLYRESRQAAERPAEERMFRSAKIIRPSEVSAKVQHRPITHHDPGNNVPRSAKPQPLTPRTTMPREPGSNASRPRDLLAYHGRWSVRAGKLRPRPAEKHRPILHRPTTADREIIRPRPFRSAHDPTVRPIVPTDRPNAAVDPKPFLKPNPHNSSPKPAPT